MSADIERTAGRLDLAALAAQANAEHALVVRGARGLVVHAMAAGDVLNCARDLMSYGEWTAWCADNVDMALHTTTTYMRLAHNRITVESWLEGGEGQSMAKALVVLRGVEPRRSGGTERLPSSTVAEIKKLRTGGATHQEIADAIGVSNMSVQRYLNPEGYKAYLARKAKKRQRDVAARRALEKAENAALVKRHGGAASEAYALIRKAALALDAAISAASSDQAKHLRKALHAVHDADNEIVAALKVVA